LAKSRKYYQPKVSLSDIISKRYNIILVLVFIIFLIVIVRLFQVQLVDKGDYEESLANLTLESIEGDSAPRGRIYDRNHKLIVDNVAVKTIYYKKTKKLSTSEEIDLAYKVSMHISLDYDKLNVTNLKEFWLANNNEEAKKRITEKEYQQLQERKITSDTIYRLKMERITEEDLDKYDDEDKAAAYMYYLMNKGYSYDEKIIKDDDVSDTEYAYIAENVEELNGFNVKLEWERKYLYGDTFKTFLGRIGSIPAEKKDEYLKKGYSLNDIVGTSYIEYQYEDILKGTKPTYKVNSDNSYELVTEAERGKDIVLSIDIELQQKLEEILEEEVKKAKKELNTKYYNHSFAIISDPNTGEILAMSGKQVIKKNGEYDVYDYSTGLLTSPVVVGSVVKGASTIVGYNSGVIDIGTKMKDECIKIKDTPLKCSWNRNGLGNINDVKALQLSSNIYQFKIAMKVGKANYQYNKALKIDASAFETYRKTYAQFGLGVKTGIDFTNESTGYKGSSTKAGHLLDFSIGQYDTYTAVQLVQYINTIANGGDRLKLNVLKEVRKTSENQEIGDLDYEIKPSILNKVDTEEKYIKRVQEGFKAVMQGSLGYKYMGNIDKPAGKTGTSESFYDSDNDGVVDKETNTTTFVGYAPYDNAKMSIAVLSPNVSYYENNSTYRSTVNKRIASRIAELYFDLYK